MAEGASDARDQALAPVRKGPPIPWSAPLPMPVLPGLFFFRASKVCRGVARFVREGKHLVALRWRDGPYACTAHAQLVAVIGRSSTGVRRLRWPALVGVLAGALHPDSQRLATVEPADPPLHEVRLRAIRSALPPRGGRRLCITPWRDWPRRHRLRGRPALWRAPQRARDPSRLGGASAQGLRAERDQPDPALRRVGELACAGPPTPDRATACPGARGAGHRRAATRCRP